MEIYNYGVLSPLALHIPPPNMAATKTGEQGKAWFSVL